MTDDIEQPGTPGYKSRRMLQEELDASKAGFAALMERIEKLETAKGTDPTQAIVEALRQDRETVLTAKLQRELDEARKQIEHLQRPESPQSGVPYSGWVQAKEDLWDNKLIRRGPSPENGYQGEIFEISLPDYWPGCPFTPMIIKGNHPDGTPIFAPHPDFQSH